MKKEFCPGDRVVYQTDNAKIYKCPFCERPIFSQYEGDDLPRVTCHGLSHASGWTANKGHTLEWKDDAHEPADAGN